MNTIEREIEKEKKAIELEKETLISKKKAFIDEIKNGLGDEMKKNVNINKIHKKSFGEIFKELLQKLFSKI